MVDYTRAFSACALAVGTALTTGCAVPPRNTAPCEGMLVVPKTSYNEYQLRRNNSWFNWSGGVNSVEVPTASGPVLMLMPRTVESSTGKLGEVIAGGTALLLANKAAQNVKDPTARTAIPGVGAAAGVAYGGPVVNQSIDNATAPFRGAQLDAVNSCTARIIRDYGAPSQDARQPQGRPVHPIYQYQPR